MFNAFFKKWAIPGLFLIHFRLFNTIYYIQLIENKIADDWIRTADLWCRKRPLYQPRHNHCPQFYCVLSLE